jgi:hypothetical protein
MKEKERIVKLLDTSGKNQTEAIVLSKFEMFFN